VNPFLQVLESPLHQPGSKSLKEHADAVFGYDGARRCSSAWRRYGPTMAPSPYIFFMPFSQGEPHTNREVPSPLKK
jgi:hypothetical protein